MAVVVEVTKDTFAQEVLQESLPVIVDFWAPWCGPCVRLTPILEELAAEYRGKLKFVKMMVNFDDESNFANTYQIRAVPTLLVFKGGVPFQRMMGFRSKRELIEKFIKPLLAA